LGPSAMADAGTVALKATGAAEDNANPSCSGSQHCTQRRRDEAIR
jgi:hypothetical protein